VAGDFAFGRFAAWADVAMAALANHGLELRLHFRGPLPGTDALPRQRWTFLGGAGTFPAFGIATFRGDRLAFVETTYIIPLGPRPGPDALPRQRWTFLGGAGTFPAFGIATFRGARLAFVETTYIIPLGPRFDVPFLGQPDLELLHVAGMAWTRGQDRDLEQNVAVQLRFPFVTARLATDPTDPVDAARLDLGLTLPRAGRSPWEPVR